MYTRCLLCRASFPENGVLGRLPRGDRVAYDLQRGRLWQVCRSCGRWSLVPMADRWEALEEMDRLLCGKGPAAHLLARTENVALFRVDAGPGSPSSSRPLEVVRIAGAGPAEEAWWRFGRPLEGGPRFPTSGRLPEGGRAGRRTRLRGRRARRPWRWKTLPPAWKGQRSCPGCGYMFTELPVEDRKIVVVRPEELGAGAGADDSARSSLDVLPPREGSRDRSRDPARDPPRGLSRDPPRGLSRDPPRGLSRDPPRGLSRDPPLSFSLARRCPRCRDVDRGGLHLTGLAADLALGRMLALENRVGASLDRIRGAIRVIDDAGGPGALVGLLTRHGRPLGDLPSVGVVALEIYAVQARERALLAMEARGLEARWRREEELAALVDGDLSPLPLLERLKQRMGRDS